MKTKTKEKQGMNVADIRMMTLLHEAIDSIEISGTYTQHNPDIEMAIKSTKSFDGADSRKAIESQLIELLTETLERFKENHKETLETRIAEEVARCQNK